MQYTCLGLVIIIHAEFILVHCSSTTHRIPLCNVPQVPWIHSAWVDAHICSIRFWCMSKECKLVCVVVSRSACSIVMFPRNSVCVNPTTIIFHGFQ